VVSDLDDVENMFIKLKIEKSFPILF
jgi:hypothetical protein